MNWLRDSPRLLEQLGHCPWRRCPKIQCVGVFGLFALGAELHPWAVIRLATIGMIVGALFVLGLQAARRRLRRQSNIKRRIGSLESLVVGEDPLTSDSPQRTDRGMSIANGHEAGPVEETVGISNRDAAQGTVSDRDAGADDVDDSVEASPVSNSGRAVGLEAELRSIESSTTAALLDTTPDDSPPMAEEAHGLIQESAVPAGISTQAGSSSDLDSSADEADLADLTADEMAMLFNRYEYLAREELDGISDNGADVESEIWLDLTQGEAWAHIDTTRSTSEGRWVHLRSGQVICKLRGSDAWVTADDPKREPIKPLVVVMFEVVSEPTELTFVIPRSPRA